MADLWWVSWVLLMAALLGIGAWVGFLRWWFRQHSSTRIEKSLVKKTVMKKDERITQSLVPRHENSTIVRFQSPTMEEHIIFPSNPENLMWRPPPRESLLHRQQVKARLGKPAARIESSRSRIAAPPLPHTTLPPPTKTEPSSFQPPSEPMLKITTPESKIGRKRQGLESLVNVVPVESGYPDESKNS